MEGLDPRPGRLRPRGARPDPRPRRPAPGGVALHRRHRHGQRGAGRRRLHLHPGPAGQCRDLQAVRAQGRARPGPDAARSGHLCREGLARGAGLVGRLAGRLPRGVRDLPRRLGEVDCAGDRHGGRPDPARGHRPDRGRQPQLGRRRHRVLLQSPAGRRRRRQYGQVQGQRLLVPPAEHRSGDRRQGAVEGLEPHRLHDRRRFPGGVRHAGLAPGRRRGGLGRAERDRVTRLRRRRRPGGPPGVAGGLHARRQGDRLRASRR